MLGVIIKFIDRLPSNRNKIVKLLHCFGWNDTTVRLNLVFYSDNRQNFLFSGSKLTKAMDLNKKATAANLTDDLVVDILSR